MNPGTIEVFIALLAGFGISLVLCLIFILAGLVFSKRHGSIMMLWQWPQAAWVPLFFIFVSVVVFIATSSLAWRSFAATMGFAGLWAITSMALVTRRVRKALGDKAKSSTIAG